MKYSKAALKAVEVKEEIREETEEIIDPMEVYKYDSGFNDKAVSARDIEIQKRLANSQTKYHTENNWNPEWGRKPPRAQASDHYDYWRDKYDEDLHFIFYRVKNLTDEDHTDSLEFEDFTDFAYSCSSGYISE